MGFRMILDSHDDIEVVADVADGVSAVSKARELRPDVSLLDIRMPGLDGLEVTRQLAGPDVADPLKVVVVTTFDLDEYVHTALRNGASGFLLKDAGPALLIEAVRAADRGDALVSPQITVRLLKHFDGAGSPKSKAAPPSEPLTAREMDVVKAGRARADEQRDRRRAVHVAVHREDPPGVGAEQDRRAQPRRNRGVGVAERSRLVIASA